MKVLIINNKTKRLAQLKKLLKKDKFEIIKLGEVVMVDASEYDLIILSGSSKFSIIGNEDLYRGEIDLIKSSKAPIIGICLGFELISHAYGASLSKVQRKRKGIVDIQVTHPSDIFENLPNFKVYESHRWVVNKLPDTLVELARSKDGIEAIKHKSRQVYGFQFHPEMFAEKTCGDEIFNNLLKNLR
jgi:GMP synthase (glutamine-hydrolysing)